jgi:hypothetical protein
MAVVNTRPQAVLSHCKGDTSEPVVEYAIGDALRLAAQKWGGPNRPRGRLSNC